MHKLNNILLVGGSGFLGQHLANQLINKKYNVTILDRVKPRWVDGKYDFCEGDFSALHLLSEVMNNCDAVFHLASTTLPKSSNDDPLFDVSSNLLGTLGLLDLSVQKNVKKFIFMSSGGTIYGPPSVLPVPEIHPTMPTCSYGIVKLSIEKYLRLYNQLYGLQTCSLRLANPYGEFQRVDSAQGAVAVFCHKALKGEPIEVWGDGSVVRDFVYVEDAVEAMMKSLEVDCSCSEINIGSGAGSSLLELISAIENSLGRHLSVDFLPARKFDVPKVYLDVNVAQEVLGWVPKTPLRDGVSRLISWLQNI